MEKIFKLCMDPKKTIEIIDEFLIGLNYKIEADFWDVKIIIYNACEEMLDRFISMFDDYIFTDEDLSLAECVVSLLYNNNLNFAVAESCSGGLVSSLIVAVPGCSEVFYEGIVSYSNLAKIKRLLVSEDTISIYGAVSGEVALEMAQGLLSEDVLIGLSTTGIAGPSGDSEEKPLGTVYIAVADNENFKIIHESLSGTRNEVRRKTAQLALFHLIQFLINYYI